jgi:hypothetical protein
MCNMYMKLEYMDFWIVLESFQQNVLEVELNIFKIGRIKLRPTPFMCRTKTKII